MENCFQNMNCFSWIKIIPVLIHLKYWYCNSIYLELPCLSHHFCQILPCLSNFSQLKPFSTQSPCSSLVSLFCPTPLDYTLLQVLNIPNICKVKPVKFIIKLYTDHNTLRVKHATHQKTESLKAASLSKLVNMVNSNFIFNTKYAEFSTKW